VDSFANHSDVLTVSNRCNVSSVQMNYLLSLELNLALLSVSNSRRFFLFSSDMFAVDRLLQNFAVMYLLHF